MKLLTLLIMAVVGRKTCATIYMVTSAVAQHLGAATVDVQLQPVDRLSRAHLHLLLPQDHL